MQSSFGVVAEKTVKDSAAIIWGRRVGHTDRSRDQRHVEVTNSNNFFYQFHGVGWVRLRWGRVGVGVRQQFKICVP